MKKWGFTVQETGRKAFGHCNQEVQNWLKNEYPGIKKPAMVEKAEIQWWNEMEVRSGAALARHLSLEAPTSVVAEPGERPGCNMISSINNRGTLRFMVFTEEFTTEVMIDFLKRLSKQMDRKVFLIVDGHPVHRSGAVKKFVAEKENQIRLFQLPAGGSELNPDDLLNQDAVDRRV